MLDLRKERRKKKPKGKPEPEPGLGTAHRNRHRGRKAGFGARMYQSFFYPFPLFFHYFFFSLTLHAERYSSFPARPCQGLTRISRHGL